MEFLNLKYNLNQQKIFVISKPINKFFFLTFFLLAFSLLLVNFNLINVNYIYTKNYKIKKIIYLKEAFFIFVFK